MSFYLKTENESPTLLRSASHAGQETHAPRFSCRVNPPEADRPKAENAYRGFQVQNPGKRFYNPGMGRWLSRDPIDDELALDLYQFCQNDSVNNSDLLGLRPWGTGNMVVSEGGQNVAYGAPYWSPTPRGRASGDSWLSRWLSERERRRRVEELTE